MQYKIIVYTPSSHTKQIIKAMGDAGGGVIGKYTHCAYVTHGTGNWLSGEGSNPTIGAVGKMSSEPEDKIEMTCDLSVVKPVVQAIHANHPYETPAIDIQKLHNPSIGEE